MFESFSILLIVFLFIFFYQDIRLSDPELDCTKLLEEIAAEQKFDATFVDIEEKSHSGLVSYTSEYSF